MLNSIGLLGDEDLQAVQRELKKIHADIVAGRFTIDEGIEDVHSQVEFLLTERIGDAGKKLHSCLLYTSHRPSPTGFPDARYG